MYRLLFFLFIASGLSAQTVSTYFSDPGVDVDDAMVFDSDGNLYGSNFAGTTVYKIDTNGNATEFVTGITNPNGLAIDSEGNVFIVAYGEGTIYKYSSDGSQLDSYDVGSFPSGLMKSPSSDDMFFTLTSNNSVNVLSPNGDVTQIFQGAPLDSPVGLAFDENESLYVGNFVGREIYRISGGEAVYIAEVPADGGGSNAFLGFITYGNERLYGTNLGSHRIYEINPTITDGVTVLAGSEQGDEDGDVSQATFDTPNGIIYNDDENALYISEFSGEGNIRRIDLPSFGVEDVASSFDITLAPNPSSEFIEVNVDRLPVINEMLEFEVYTTLGQKVGVEVNELSTHTFRIDISKLTNGMYVLKILTNGVSSTVKKFNKY